MSQPLHTREGFDIVAEYNSTVFALSNLPTVVFIPDTCREKWAIVYNAIASNLCDAIQHQQTERESTGSVDEASRQRLSVAAKWYVAIAPIFLRDSKNNSTRAATILRRLDEFLNGSYTKIIEDWLQAVDNAENHQVKKKDEKDKKKKKKKKKKSDTNQDIQLNHAMKLFYEGFVSKALSIVESHGLAPTDNKKVIQQMVDKHPRGHHTWDEFACNPDLIELGPLEQVTKEALPYTGVGVRRLRTNHLSCLAKGKFYNDSAKLAFKAFERLGKLYLSNSMPSWLYALFGTGLLVPIHKKQPVDNQDPDARPVCMESGADVLLWCKAASRALVPAVMRQVMPQQLAIGLSGGVDALILGTKLIVEQAKKSGEKLVVVGLDLKNAHNSFSREATREAVEKLVESTGDESLRYILASQLSRANNQIFYRTKDGQLGYKLLCRSERGGRQGNALTNLLFPLTIDAILKESEAKHKGVINRAIQDDITMIGHPDQIFGLNGQKGSLDSILEQLELCGLKANKRKFQVYGVNGGCDMKPSWLPRPSVTRGGKTSHGIWICGAAVGDDDYIEAKLEEAERELCGEEGTIMRLTSILAERDAHVAHTSLLYSLQCRADFLLATHLPSQTSKLASSIDEALVKAYAIAYNTNLFQPADDDQEDRPFVPDLAALRIKYGGIGFRKTTERCPYLNAMSNIFETFPEVWPTLVDGVFGGSDYFLGINSHMRWRGFLASGSLYAIQLEHEWHRIQNLAMSAKSSIESPLSPSSSSSSSSPPPPLPPLPSASPPPPPAPSPSSSSSSSSSTSPSSSQSTSTNRTQDFTSLPEPLNVPAEGLGAGIDKLQKQSFNVITQFRNEAMKLRARNLPVGDPRRNAYFEAVDDPFAKTLMSSLPNNDCAFTSEEFRSAVQNKFAVDQTMCLPYLGLPITNSPNCRSELVDPLGYSIKTTSGIKGDGIRHLHDQLVDVISSWLSKARVPHQGGKYGNPRTCNGLFTQSLTPLQGGPPSDEVAEVRQGIIPDICWRHQGSNKNEDVIGDVKTLAPGTIYNIANPQTATEVKANNAKQSYRRVAAKLDQLIHKTPPDVSGPVSQQLHKFSGGGVKALVVGAYAGVSKDIKDIADWIGTALAADYCSNWDVTPKIAKGIIKHRLHQELGMRIHRGWARLLIDRIQNYVHISTFGPPCSMDPSHMRSEAFAMREHNDMLSDTFVHKHSLTNIPRA